MYNVDFLLFPKNFVSICLNSIHENYCVYMCCPIFSGSTSTPSQLSALGRSLQKSWLCSGQRDLCWLTECCCHNLSSWLLRRMSCRPQSSSPESSETCNFPWSSQSPHTYVDGQQGGVLQDLCEFQHALQDWGSGPWKSTKSPKRANLFRRWACMPAFTYSYMLTSS